MNMMRNLPKQIEQSLLFTLDEALDNRLHQNGACVGVWGCNQGKSNGSGLDCFCVG